MPKVSFLPDTIKKILRPIAKKHGSVLFATWSPNSKKYSKGGYVPVTRKDVRRKHKFIDPFYVTALISNHPFKGDSLQYLSRGRNQDYQFSLFFNPPKLNEYNYWVMEVIASEKDSYYSFVCIMDKGYITNQANYAQQTELFVQDIRNNFFKGDPEEM